MSRLAFDPHVHAFHFANNFNNYGPVNTVGLCGGMCLAAFNYFRYNIPIPYYTQRDMAPYFAVHYDVSLSTARETPPLVSYLLQSQMVTFENVSVAAFVGPDDPRYGDEAATIKHHIDRGEYAIVGLKARPGEDLGHQVLCYGYDDADNQRLFVYDPNFPDLECAITPAAGGFITVTSERGATDLRYRAIFMEQELFANVTSDRTTYNLLDNTFRNLNFAVRPPVVPVAPIGTASVVIDRIFGLLDLFWVHPDGSINTTWRNGDDPWDVNRVQRVTAAGKGAGGAVAVVARIPNHLDLFWVHPEGSVNSTWWHDSQGWGPERVFAATSANEVAGRTVSALARKRDHLDLFWAGRDGSVRSTWWDANVAGGSWDMGRVISVSGPDEAAVGTPSVVARTPDHLDVFWLSGDGQIRSTWWDAAVAGGAWPASRAFTVPGSGTSMSAPTVVARTPDHLDVFWVDPNGSVKSTWWDASTGWNGGGSIDITASGAATSAPITVVARATDHMDLFWINPDGSVSSTWWDANEDSGGWPWTRVFGVTAPGTAVAAMLGVIARSPSSMGVFWVQADGSLHTTSWDRDTAGGTWDINRISAVTSPGVVLR